MRTQLIVSILIGSMTNTAFSIEIDGRYESAVEIENLENGLSAKMINFLEIETTDKNSIYFVYESWHTNGHACRLYGAAQKTDHGIYEHIQKNEILSNSNYCKVRIYTNDINIVVEDVDERCGADNCGARGKIGKSTFPLNSHKNLSIPVAVPW